MAPVIMLLAAQLVPADALAQVEAQAVLTGNVMVGDSAMRSGTVVLHRISDTQQGEVDSVRVTEGGAFSLTLPGVPNEAFGDIYFASVRHQGVMYFGTAITQAVQLDSAYLIQAWDTVLAPAEGMPVTVEGRTLFLDVQGDSWIVTDAITLRNDLDRTVVARPEGIVWTYPLPSTAADVITGEGEITTDVVTYDSGELIVRGALPPGPRMFVVRYTLATTEVSIPTPGTTEFFDILVREPAPALDVTGLSTAPSEELEGRVYRRYTGENVAVPSVQIALGEELAPPPVHWVAVVLAGILGAGAVLAIGKTSGRAGARTSTPRDAREDLLLEVARLDEAHQENASPTESAAKEYEARRAALLARLRSGA
jgi:hypothetical protein